ncbi:hypothetical protein ABVT39_005499 [Epinephelus coioides]
MGAPGNASFLRRALKEMCEEIAELNFSLNQQKDLNAKMRQWLDASDDEMAMLRSDNAILRKQVKDQEKIIREAQQVEAEPCRGLLADDLEAKKCLKKKIQELEKESNSLKEQNKQLTAELKSLQQERDRDKITLRKSKAALQALEWEMSEAELGLQVRDEVIHQRDLQLKYAKETVEECSNIIEDLRLTNRALNEQLEDRLDEASLATENDLMGGKEGPLSPPLSFALEMKLLASSAEVKTSMSDSTDLRNEEAEKLRKPQSLTVELRPLITFGNPPKDQPVTVIISLHSRPSQLKALPGGLVCDLRKTPPPSHTERHKVGDQM